MGCVKSRGEALQMEGSATEGGILISGQSDIFSFPSKLVQFFFYFIFFFLFMEFFDSDLQVLCVIFSIFFPKAGM